ncbi:MAG: hypothetical protein EAX96_09815 [Candidatus Lokiarchaeota archaeon]|nr:hypothetical protein [Candidatus Lokiarchaeota archaeon]
MNKLKFSCKKCGNCCKNRYLCFYFFEKGIVDKYKGKIDSDFELESFRFYFDLTNKKIIDIIYRINTKPCPFFDSSCMIQSQKFISCQKYPINTFIDLGFLSLLGFNKLYFDIDKECSFIKKTNNFIKNLKNQKLEKLFPTEYDANLKDYEIWKNIDKKIKYYKINFNFNILIDFKLKKRKISDYRTYLKNWDHLNFDEYEVWLGSRTKRYKKL